MTYDYIFVRKSNGEYLRFYSNGGVLTGNTDNPVIELFRTGLMFDEDKLIIFLYENFTDSAPSISWCLENGRVIDIEFTDNVLTNFSFIKRAHW